jgi:GntR family transcriptional regulator
MAMPGTMLPGELELALSFGASRNAVREALHLLRDEGLIERHQGAGTFVVAQRCRHRFDRLQHFEDGVEAGARRVSNVVLAAETVAAPPVVAEVLGLEPGATTLLLERLTLVDRTPTMLSTGYIPGELAEGTLDHPLDRNVYALWESLGLDLDVADMEIGAVGADGPVAALLEVPVGAPLLRLERIIRLRDGRALEYGVSFLRGDQMVMVTQLPRHPQGSCDA